MLSAKSQTITRKVGNVSMSLVKVKDNKVTIPKKLRVKLDINDGDYLDLKIKGKAIVLEKFEDEEDESWFLSPEWQEKEREADKAIAEGRLSPTFDTAEEAIKYLRRQSRKWRKLK